MANYIRKKIAWITVDSFLDTDGPIVPYLMDNYDYDINWIVINRGKNPISCSYSYRFRQVFNMHHDRDLANIFFYKTLFSALHLENMDLIYSSSICFPFYYPILHLYNKRNIPIIHAAHNVIPYAVWSIGLRLAVKFTFLHNQYFQMFSQKTANYFSTHYPKKSIFYCPMSVKDFGAVITDNYPIDKTKVNLLFFGNIIDNKRLDLLIDAVKQLPPDIANNIHLSICGNCKVNKDKYLRQIGNTKNISVYFKRIPDEDIPELFSKHQYLMLPYEDVAQSGPHMIAYNYNLPVIASNIDGFAERIEDGINGFLFNIGNINSLVDTIIKATKLNAAEYLKLKLNLSNYVEQKYSVPTIVKQYNVYFKSIIK